jgi:hypothetical protein
MSLQGLPYGFLPARPRRWGCPSTHPHSANAIRILGITLVLFQNSLPLKPILTQVVVHSSCLRVSVVKMLSGSEHFTSKESITRWGETRAKATRDNVPIRSQSLALSADSTHNPASVYKRWGKATNLYPQWPARRTEGCNFENPDPYPVDPGMD